jgi:DNA-binding response OmpR family regulator
MAFAPAAHIMPPQVSNVDEPNRRSDPGAAGGDHRLQPLMIVVDDDVATLDLLCEIADESGWAALGYTRMAAFRAALERERPDLVIIDDDLPDGRGGDLARELGDDPRMADVPVLVCTGAHPMRQAEIGGWAPVIAKPFDLGEIEDVLEQGAHRRGDGDQRRSFGRAG